jgi:acetyltransferase-like isoleucine patch superfamily enzyme
MEKRNLERLIDRLTSVMSIVRSSYYFERNCFQKGRVIRLLAKPRVFNPQFVAFHGRAHFGHHFWLDCISKYYDENFKYQPSVEFGDSFSCGNNCHIGATGCIKIGDNVLLGSHILITDHAHGIYSSSVKDSSPLENPVERELDYGHICIGDRVWIGDGVKILGSVKIGSGSIVGAGSIVTKDIPANSIVCGNPSRIVKQWDDCTKKWVKV